VIKAREITGKGRLCRTGDVNPLRMTRGNFEGSSFHQEVEVEKTKRKAGEGVDAVLRSLRNATARGCIRNLSKKHNEEGEGARRCGRSRRRYSTMSQR